jgi:hypothetical protein
MSAGRLSGSAWPARSRPARRCCCSMSPPRRWIRLVLPHNAGMQRINSSTPQLFPASSPAVQRSHRRRRADGRSGHPPFVGARDRAPRCARARPDPVSGETAPVPPASVDTRQSGVLLGRRARPMACSGRGSRVEEGDEVLGQLDGARQRHQVPAGDHLHVPSQSRPSYPALEVNGEEPVIGPGQHAGGDVRPPV